MRNADENVKLSSQVLIKWSKFSKFGKCKPGKMNTLCLR